MVLTAAVAVFLGRQSMPILNLTLAAILILFIWPQALLEISFQLTFAATLGIMTLGQWIQGKFVRGSDSYVTGPAGLYPRPTSSLPQNRTELKMSKPPAAGARRGSPAPVTRNVPATPRKNSLVALFINNAAVATSAFIFTAPVIYYHFDRVVLISPLVNVLVAELVVPVMILGFLIAGAGLIFMPLAQFLAYLVYVPALVFVKLVEVFSGQ